MEFYRNQEKRKNLFNDMARVVGGAAFLSLSAFTIYCLMTDAHGLGLLWVPFYPIMLFLTTTIVGLPVVILRVFADERDMSPDTGQWLGLKLVGFVWVIASLFIVWFCADIAAGLID